MAKRAPNRDSSGEDAPLLGGFQTGFFGDELVVKKPVLPEKLATSGKVSKLAKEGQASKEGKPAKGAMSAKQSPENAGPVQEIRVGKVERSAAKPAPKPAAKADAKAGGKAGGKGGSKSGSRSPNALDRFVVLCGSEEFLRALHTKALKEALAAAYGEIDVARFDGLSCTPAEILDECRSFGLIARHKLVVVDDADEIVKEVNRPIFERYAHSLAQQDPADVGATLLFRCGVWRAGKLDQLIYEVGVVLACEALKEPQAIGWATVRAAKRYFATFGAGAAEMLVERVGTDMGRLDGEIAKLSAVALGDALAKEAVAKEKMGTAGSAAVSDAGALTAEQVPSAEACVISREMIAKWVGLSREEDAWTIQSALLNATPGQSVAFLRELLDVSREPAVKVAYSVTDLARKVNAATSATKAGLNPNEIASKLRLWGPAKDGVMHAAARVSPAATLKAYRACVNMDKRSKSGFCGIDEGLERMVLQVSTMLNSKN